MHHNTTHQSVQVVIIAKQKLYLIIYSIEFGEHNAIDETSFICHRVVSQCLVELHLKRSTQTVRRQRKRRYVRRTRFTSYLALFTFRSQGW